MVTTGFRLRLVTVASARELELEVETGPGLRSVFSLISAVQLGCYILSVTCIPWFSWNTDRFALQWGISGEPDGQCAAGG